MITLASATQPPQPKPHAVVIGGGIGGLATAARLAKDGRFDSVKLVEKNFIVGGRCQSLSIDEYRFDTGPSLLLFPDKYKETFDALDYPMPEIKRVEPTAYRIHYASSSSPPFTLDLLNDMDAMINQLQQLDPQSATRYPDFVKMAKDHLDLGVPYFIDRDFTELQDAKGLLDLLPRINSINPWHLLGPHDFVLKSFFKKDPRIRAAFTFQDLYVGLSPSNAPAVFSLLAGTELVDGVYYPIGGFQMITDALKSAAEQCGVEIHTDTEVVYIETNNNDTNEIVAVHTKSGERIEADVVVCNRDLPASYNLIINNNNNNNNTTTTDTTTTTGDNNTTTTTTDTTTNNNNNNLQEYAQQRTKHLSNLKYSAGIISFNWCINNTSNTLNIDRLAHHNVFLSEEFSKSWQPARNPNEYVKYPNFYMHVPTKTDPTAAPENCLSMMVLLPVANMQQMNTSNDYTELIEVGRQRVLQTLRDAGIGDVESCIQNELIISPPEWKEMYGLMHGAAFGLSHGLDQLSLFRPENKEKKVKGLYFVGASTRPGNGVPLCLISARLTAERVLKDLCYD